MSDGRRFGIVDVLLVLVVLAAAAGARGWYLETCARGGDTPGPLRVEDEAPAESIGSAPLYPWFQTLVGRITTEEGRNRLIRLVQAGLGALTAALYFLFARLVFRGRGPALLVGLFSALHPFWIINTAEMSDGVLTTFLLALALCLGGFVNRSGGYLPSWLYGLSLAGVALARWALLPFAWVAVLWYLLRCRSLQRGWLNALLAFLGFLTGLAPGAVQNLHPTHESLALVQVAYYHLWQGNNPQATGGPMTVQMPGSTSRDVGRAIWKEVKTHPADTLQRRLQAGLNFVFGEDWFTAHRLWREDGTGLANPDLPGWLRESAPAILYGTVLGMLLLAVLGWRWTFERRRQARLLALAAICIPLPYLLSHAEALQGPRLPLDGVLLCYAGYALACLMSFGRQCCAQEEESKQ